MKEALRLSGYYGFYNETVPAKEIRSREDARKLGPFIDSNRRWVHWRRPSFDPVSNRRKRRSHFAHYPRNRGSAIRIPSAEDFDPARYDELRSESSKHRKACRIVLDILRDSHSSARPAFWHFKDERASDFSFSGDLLADAQEIRSEYPYATPFGNVFRFDVAIIGKKYTKSDNVIGAVEIEFTHEFDFIKCMLTKAMGFPLLSIDITEVEEEEITYDWCQHALFGTTETDPQGRRSNFVYLHDMLYPAFSDAPRDQFGNRHQYVIVAKDSEFDQIVGALGQIKTRLGLRGNSVLIQPVNAKNDQTRKMQANEASIAGANWAEFNTRRYIRVTLDRPAQKAGPVFTFHLLMTRYINSHSDALVGYKWARGVSNSEPENPFWDVYDRTRRSRQRIMPKQLGQPLESIMRELESITR